MTEFTATVGANVVDYFGNDVFGILGTGTAVNQTSQAGSFTLNVGGEATPPIRSATEPPTTATKRWASAFRGAQRFRVGEAPTQ
jgi:hypothetical protein